MFGIGFVVTFLFTPKFIEKAIKKGYVVKDMYKKGEPTIPTMGGLTILAGVLCSLVVSQFFIIPVDKLLIFYSIVFTFAMFGLADDLLDVGRVSKIFIPFFLALPIALLDLDTTLWLGFMEIELGKVYCYLIAPLYVMVVANLVNMHSGYNGLSCGLSYIISVFIVVKTFMVTGVQNLFYIAPIFGALLAFLYFNTYPAKIFWGNIGSMMLGSALGGFLILDGMEIFGVVILIPHIANFLMYVVWRIKKLGNVKFGTLRKDGTLVVPNPWTLKWTLPYYYRLTEHQTMVILYTITTIFGVIGLVLIP